MLCISNLRMKELAATIAESLGESDYLSYRVISNAEKIIGGMKELQSPAMRFETQNRAGEVVETVF